MSRRAYIIGLVGCLAVGVVDLGLINFWLAPRGWAPDSAPVLPSAAPVAARDPAPAPTPVTDPLEPAPAPEIKPAPEPQPAPAPVIKPAPEPQPAPAPVVKPAPGPRPQLPPPDDAGVSMAVYFGSGSYSLSSPSQRLLHKVAAALKEDRNYHLRLDGYSDARGPEGYNIKLSKLRCISVRYFMIMRGIDPSRISMHALGSSRLADGAAFRTLSKPNWRHDRRVEITLLEE